jgi:hypothetical protein
MTFDKLHHANLAIQCCAASGHVRVLDVDCRDPEVAHRIKEIAFTTLGETPFVRFGAKPKMQLLYRVEGEDTKIQKWSHSLLGADGLEEMDEGGHPINAIEYLAEGAIFTAYGLHHKTMQNFDWSDGSLHPAIAGPEHAPLVTKAMLRQFTNRLQDYRQIAKPTSGSNPHGGKSVVTEFAAQSTRRGKFWAPKVSNGEWTIKDGKVVDRAEAWLTAQTWAICAANAMDLDAQMAQMMDHLKAEAIVALSGNRDNVQFATFAGIERAVEHKLRSAAQKWRASIQHHRATGRYHDGVVPWRIADDGRRAVAQRIARGARPADGSLDWVPEETCQIDQLAEHAPSIKVAVKRKDKVQIEIDRGLRDLIGDQSERRRIAEDVSQKVNGIIGDWLNGEVLTWNAVMHRDKAAPPSRPHILLGPTGAGKTVSAVGQLLEFCREHPRRPGEGPIIFLAPTHANAAELLAVASAKGMQTPDFENEEEIEAAEKAAKDMNIKMVRFRGRMNFCHRPVEMEALGKQKIGASALCGAEVEVGDGLDRKRAKAAGEKLPKEKMLCAFRERGECEYWTQMDDLRDADIVVMTHKYLMEKLFKELRDPRAIIIDESVTYSLLGQVRIPLSTFKQARREPFVKDSDKKRWPKWSNADIAAYYTGAREELTGHLLHWIKEGQDIAVELAKLPNAHELLAASIELCERANDRSRKVRPDLTAEQVLKLANEATGRYLIDEIRFWKTVRDRMERTAQGTAKGTRDMRWQVVEDWEKDPATEELAWTQHVRLSWRVAPNWAGRPTMLLDASARPKIIEKQFGITPVVHHVEAPMRVRTVAMIERTWSNSSFLPRPDSTDDELKLIAQNISDARKLITTQAVLFGHGRVVVGTTVKIREVLTGGGWAAPRNVDFVHYGALRGLDFAKNHVCAISIGRTEQPIGVIDGLQAALTFDDDEPEEPFDRLGTGLTADGKPLFRPQHWSTIRMRTGQDIDHMIPHMSGRQPKMKDGKQETDERGNPLFVTTWAYELEQSWREEELKQFVGRLRPVFRNIHDDLPPPVWLACGKILPEDTIVDELLELKPLLKAWPLAELVRLGGGILADNVTPFLPGAQDVLHGRTLAELAKDLPRAPAFLRRWAAPFVHVRYKVASDGGTRKRSGMLLPTWIDGDAVAYWMALSERHGEIPDVAEIHQPKLAAAEAKAKPMDKRDIDRDDALIAESKASKVHYAEAGAAEHGRADFELRRARGLCDLPEPTPA